MEKEKLKTGTTIVGVVGKDCVILGADKRVTLAGRLVVDKRFNKKLQVNENLIVAMAGTVSDAQLLTKYLRANLKLNELRRNKKNDIKESVNFLANILYSAARQFIPAIVGFLVAGRDEKGVHLYEVGIDGSIIEYEDFEGKIYKITRRLPDMSIAETKIFRSKEGGKWKPQASIFNMVLQKFDFPCSQISLKQHSSHFGLAFKQISFPCLTIKA